MLEKLLECLEEDEHLSEHYTRKEMLNEIMRRLKNWIRNKLLAINIKKK